ncbi:hypothetical protein CDL12_10976 [Handroanthus impetiginosus]|uniref:Uncharacterized protein n=1 Tax=Handroanthus impetiginosus TaxID=429701 RepID=A0A2G9HG01_9LAMI|nr:hypothetical protein CDL12_10976 [Handroanthus impetiginosus]
MKGVLNEADMGRLKIINIAAYLTEEANRAGEMEKRHALELEKAKEEALRAALEEAVNKFKGSKEFEGLVLDRAERIYEQTVQDCRKILQGTGRVSEEDLLLLDPGLPLNFARDGRMVGTGDAEDGADGDNPPKA